MPFPASGSVIIGDCVDVMRSWPENIFDAIVCDPPYGLEFMGKEWDKLATPKPGNLGGFATGNKPSFERVKNYLPAMYEWHFAWACEAWRVLKPGAHLLAFGGTRTFHRLTCALEDAGFEIRDCLMWLYGSGFPKSLDVSKAIDKAADYRLQAEIRRAAVSAVEAAGLVLPNNSRWDWTVGEHAPGPKWWDQFRAWLPTLSDDERERVEGEIVARVKKTAGWFTSRDIYDVRSPATDAARQWSGWGTALKPAWEPIILARKPLSESNVAANVLKHGTGAINVDATRVATEGASPAAARRETARRTGTTPTTREKAHETESRGKIGNRAAPEVYAAERPGEQLGRWPANVVLSHTDDCVPRGTREVKSSNAGEGSRGWEGWEASFKGGATTPRGGPPSTTKHAVDGKETVERWACVPECPVRMLDAQSGELKSGRLLTHHKRRGGKARIGTFDIRERTGEPANFGGDVGGASRFFYCAKASRGEREAGLENFPLRTKGAVDGERVDNSLKGPTNALRPDQATLVRNVHPTVKPIALMRYLCRLITPPDGLILDPFVGSGTTIIAAQREGFRAVGIEKSPEYAAIARQRIMNT